jgi:hypothetical protein
VAGRRSTRNPGYSQPVWDGEPRGRAGAGAAGDLEVKWGRTRAFAGPGENGKAGLARRPGLRRVPRRNEDRSDRNAVLILERNQDDPAQGQATIPEMAEEVNQLLLYSEKNTIWEAHIHVVRF